MRFKHWLTIAAAACLLLPVSCRPEMDFVENSFRSGQAEASESAGIVTMLFGSGSGSASIELSANRSWEASFVNDRARNWCTLSTVSGDRGTATLTVEVTMNGEYDERSASILFTCGDVTRTIVVTQKQKDALLLTGNRIYVPQTGGTFQVEVRSNVDFTSALSYPGGETPSGWIHAVSTKGLQQHILVFQVDANETIFPREGDLTIRSPLGEEVVRFYQEGEVPTLVVSSHREDIDPAGGPFEVQVTSNLDVEITVPQEVSWMREVKTKSLSTQTYAFFVERNDLRKLRSCYLFFRNAELAMSDSVRVVQKYQPIVLSDTLVRVPYREIPFSIRVSGDDPGDFRLKLSDRWIEQDGMEKDGEDLLFHFKAAANGSGKERKGTVSVYYKDFEQPDRVTVQQSEEVPSFSFTTLLTEVSVPYLASPDVMTFVYWGDDTYQIYEGDLTHRYGEAGPHTVTIEGRKLTDVFFPRPENGMSFDFSILRKR